MADSVSGIDIPDDRFEERDARILVVIDLPSNRGIGIVGERHRERPMIARGHAEESCARDDGLLRHHLAVLVTRVARLQVPHRPQRLRHVVTIDDADDRIGLQRYGWRPLPKEVVSHSPPHAVDSALILDATMPEAAIADRLLKADNRGRGAKVDESGATD